MEVWMGVLCTFAFEIYSSSAVYILEYVNFRIYIILIIYLSQPMYSTCLTCNYNVITNHYIPLLWESL
jgi:hypothetical protein